MSHQQLDTYYESVLKSLGVTLDDKRILRVYDNNVTITTPEGGKLPVVLPNQDLLVKGFRNDSTIAPFHPLCENIVRGGESEVFKLIKELVTLSVHTYVYTFGITLLKQASDLPAKTPARIIKALQPLGEVDDKALKELSKVLDAMSVRGKNRISTVRTRRGGVIDGKEYNRVASINFKPLWDMINGDDDSRILGVKLRKKDIKTFEALMVILLGPNYHLDEAFIGGSSHTSSPYYLSLMTAYTRMLDRMAATDKVFHTWGDFPTVLENYTVFAGHMSIDDHVACVDKLSSLWPQLPYNSGVTEVGGNVVKDGGAKPPPRVSTASSTPKAALPHLQEGKRASTASTAPSTAPAPVGGGLPHLQGGRPAASKLPPPPKWVEGTNELYDAIRVVHSTNPYHMAGMKFTVDGKVVVTQPPVPQHYRGHQPRHPHPVRRW